MICIIERLRSCCRRSFVYHSALFIFAIRAVILSLINCIIFWYIFVCQCFDGIVVYWLDMVLGVGGRILVNKVVLEDVFKFKFMCFVHEFLGETKLTVAINLTASITPKNTIQRSSKEVWNQLRGLALLLSLCLLYLHITLPFHMLLMPYLKLLRMNILPGTIMHKICKRLLDITNGILLILLLFLLCNTNTNLLIPATFVQKTTVFLLQLLSNVALCGLIILKSVR